MTRLLAVWWAIWIWIAPVDVCGQISPLPDAHRTPGAINRSITQANISKTICNPKWSTKSIRPSTRYTNRMKRMTMNQYGRTGQPSEYELDHLVPLELGGHPTDPRNLWPEPWSLVVNGEEFGAHTKDKVENFLHKVVCSGDITLAEAQTSISTDWTIVWKYMPKTPPKPKHENVVPLRFLEAR